MLWPFKLLSCELLGQMFLVHRTLRFGSILALLAWPWISPKTHWLYTLLSHTHLVHITIFFVGISTNSHGSIIMILSYFVSIAYFHFGLNMASSTEIGSLLEPMMSTIKAMLTMWSEILLCSSIRLDLCNSSVGVSRNLTLGIWPSKSYWAHLGIFFACGTITSRMKWVITI